MNMEDRLPTGSLVRLNHGHPIGVERSIDDSRHVSRATHERTSAFRSDIEQRSGVGARNHEGMTLRRRCDVKERH
jgi:hypothetical protein